MRVLYGATAVFGLALATFTAPAQAEPALSANPLAVLFGQLDTGSGGTGGIFNFGGNGGIFNLGGNGGIGNFGCHSGGFLGLGGTDGCAFPSDPTPPPPPIGPPPPLVFGATTSPPPGITFGEPSNCVFGIGGSSSCSPTIGPFYAATNATSPPGTTTSFPWGTTAIYMGRNCVPHTRAGFYDIICS